MAWLNDHANDQIAVADTGIDQFAIDEDEAGFLKGRGYGWDLTQVEGQVKLCLERGIALIWGVYEPGHLRVARHYVDRGLFSPGSNWDFYLVGRSLFHAAHRMPPGQVATQQDASGTTVSSVHIAAMSQTNDRGLPVCRSPMVAA